MSKDLVVSVTDTGKLDKYLSEDTKKQEQDKKDKQLYDFIEKKVKKAPNDRKLRAGDKTFKKCKRLLKEGASPKVLIELLEEFLREQGKHYTYYVQYFLPGLCKVIKQSKKIPNETKKQVISEITGGYLSFFNRKENFLYSRDYKEKVDDNQDSRVQLLKVVLNRNKSSFRKYLKEYINISDITDEKVNNILHLIALLKKEDKCIFLDTLMKTDTNIFPKLVDGKNQEGKTPSQVALINKIIKEEHSSYTLQSRDSTLKFLVKLLEYGISFDQIRLHQDVLKKLSKKQNEYYCQFLEKLAEQKPEIKTKVEEVIAYAINTPNIDGEYSLHLAIKNNDRELFIDLIQKGADISIKDKDGNNILHLIVKELKQKRKFEFSSLILKIGNEEGKKHLKMQFKGAINAKNRAKKTPLHYLLEYIKEKNEDKSYIDRKFEKTSRYKTLKLFLENGADITTQDKDDNNILHHITLLKGEQRIECLNLIFCLVKKEVVSKNKLDVAIKSINKQGSVPLGLALEKKAMKEKVTYLSPFQKITVSNPMIDNTTKFCAKLLEVGSNSYSLKLEEEFHTKKYYRTLLNLENYSETPKGGKERAKELRKQLEERYKIGTFSEQYQRFLRKTGSSLKAIWKYIDPSRRAGILLAITVVTTISTIVILSSLQGRLPIEVALPTIALLGVVCLIFTFGFSSVSKSIKELTIDHQISRYSPLTIKQSGDVTEQQNLVNKPEDKKVQKLLNKLFHEENPNVHMSNMSILCQFMKKLDR